MDNSTGKKSLWLFMEAVTQARVTGRRDLAHKMFAELIPHLDEYAAPPDLWHNVSMEAAQIDHELEIAIVQAALREWPENVDLLCDELQMRYSTHMDAARAAEIWEQLDKMDRKITGGYWRFWSYGAIYHAMILKQRSNGLKLLDDGLHWVTRDNLMDILYAYRRILIDASPEEPIADIIAFQKDAMKQLEAKYLLGIQMGVENSYVLARELARLYQEQAGVSDPSPDGEGASTSQRDYLQSALDALDLAEKLYTGDPNHPIYQIYQVRVRVLMAQKKFSDALKILECLPISGPEDPSIQTMKTLAEQMLGRARPGLASGAPSQPPTESREEDQGEILNKALIWLLANNGELLTKIARDHAEVAAVIRQIASEF
jgi:hypothetical protein